MKKPRVTDQTVVTWSSPVFHSEDMSREPADSSRFDCPAVNSELGLYLSRLGSGFYSFYIYLTRINLRGAALTHHYGNQSHSRLQTAVFK